ncbi:hypothetical protein THRCLA_03535 [Thraustotheca clavata]|uniref:Uncharacterized protein n=1 Tax=Thraustotheca clavata TaxID=74557 RepID=A0A1W0A1Q7_9STRA|nr:hypothetical protein THRCLA_03535 [Thraustotheca clavata]
MSSLLSGIRFGNSEDTKKDKKKKEAKKNKKKDREPLPPKAPLEREEWMNMDFATERKREVKLTADEQRLADEEVKRQEEIASGKREPNTGLLYGLYDPKKPQQDTATSTTKATVGDGGASWKAKMLQRAKDRARETGQALEDIVRSQYGTDLATLEEQARGARVDAHLHYKRHHDSRNRRSDGNGGDKALIAKFNKRMERSGPKTSLSEGSSSQQADDDEPIDYSKLPDSEDESYQRKPRHREYRQKSRRSRSRSRDRSRKRDRSQERSRQSKQSSPKKKYKPEPVPVNKELEEEVKKRAAFLYGSLSAPRANPVSPPPIVNEPDPVAPTIEPVELPTLENGEVDLNKLAARALRAKMRGNLVAFEKFTKLLNEAERTQLHGSVAARSQVRAREPLRPEDMCTGSKKGKRTKMDDGQHLSVNDLVRNERSAKDIDDVHMKNILRLGTRYDHSDGKGASASGLDEEDRIDMRMYRDTKERLTENAYAQSSERAMLKSRIQWDTAMQKCSYCTQSDMFKKHLTVAMGEYVYLALPSSATIVPGQCIIAPLEHVPSITGVDESTIYEVEKFKSALRKMWQSQGHGVVFLETTMNPNKKRHTVIECVPIPLNLEGDIPLYFKQGLLECDEEWATHKKIIDTSEKGLQRSIPSQFAYFHVEWATGGYGHIIEDATQFPKDFGMDILAGILEVDPRRYGRYHASIDREKDRVEEFLVHWKSYNWTDQKD